ncbi:cyclin-dependent kinases regulatory subunit 2 [Suricata suricatta]|uniref:cyclin-dependent kinases regulatory subunit 2 n=1 Tax=Suricata suricatta TaxID=37032 RepID=UPI001155A799|nr:cyclin-dependent kinases regulatory subunit 2 [Suricata suricatta]
MAFALTLEYLTQPVLRAATRRVTSSRAELGRGVLRLRGRDERKTSVSRHVMLPRELSKQVPKTHLMSEEEWRRLGVQQSLGWVHYMIHEPEPHILLFRRPLPKEQQK